MDTALPPPHLGASFLSQHQQGQVTWPQWKWPLCPGSLSQPDVRTLRPRAPWGFFVGLYLYNRLLLGRQPDTKLAARKEEVSPLPGGQPGPGHTRTIGTKILFILQSPGRKSRLSHLKKNTVLTTTAQPLLPICSAYNLQSSFGDTV